MTPNIIIKNLRSHVSPVRPCDGSEIRIHANLLKVFSIQQWSKNPVVDFNNMVKLNRSLSLFRCAENSGCG